MPVAQPGQPVLREKRVLTLQDCINRALELNVDVLKAREEAKKARGFVIQARADSLPSVVANTSQEKNAIWTLNNSRSGVNQSDQEYQWTVGLQVNQTIYSGGRVSGNIRIAQLQEDSVLFTLQTTIENTLLQVRKAYNLVLLSRAQIEVSEESIRLLQQEVDNQVRRFNAGTVTRYNVLRAEVSLANEKPNLIRAKNQLRVTLAELAKLLAYDADPRNIEAIPFTVVGELNVRGRPFDLGESLMAALANRPEIKAQAKLVDVQREQLKVDASNQKPQFGAYGGYDMNGYRIQHDTDNISGGFTVGVQGQWNIFDGFLTRGRLQSTNASLNQAKLTVDDTRRGVELDVRQAYSRYLEALELIESQKKNVETAEEALRLAVARFDAGAGTQTETLQSQVDLTAARTNELQARYDYNNARADMERATSTAVLFMDMDEMKIRAARYRATNPRPAGPAAPAAPTTPADPAAPTNPRGFDPYNQPAPSDTKPKPQTNARPYGPPRPAQTQITSSAPANASGAPATTTAAAGPDLGTLPKPNGLPPLPRSSGQPVLSAERPLAPGTSAP
ncbi:MAG: TolC family protein [Candidatus Methylacidiphilales bacterium]|nr:TolC family protein [Candidatus Methylacidiphilales bacterium]